MKWTPQGTGGFGNGPIFIGYIRYHRAGRERSIYILREARKISSFFFFTTNVLGVVQERINSSQKCSEATQLKDRSSVRKDSRTGTLWDDQIPVFFLYEDLITLVCSGSLYCAANETTQLMILLRGLIVYQTCFPAWAHHEERSICRKLSEIRSAKDMDGKINTNPLSCYSNLNSKSMIQPCVIS